MSKAADQISPLIFKQVTSGYVFRAPNPRVSGTADYYLVNESQRDEILAILTPRRPLLLLVAWIGGLVLALGAGIIPMFTYVGAYPITALLVLTMVTLIVSILVQHLSAGRKLRRLEPILIGLPRTEQQITIAEIRHAMNRKLSFQQLRRAAILYAIACAISVASVAAMIYLRKPHASWLSDPLWFVLSFNTVIFGFSSVLSYLNALEKEHADGMGPAAYRILFTSAGALLVFLATSAWVRVKREYSHQMMALRRAPSRRRIQPIGSYRRAKRMIPTAER